MTSRGAGRTAAKSSRGGRGGASLADGLLTLVFLLLPGSRTVIALLPYAQMCAPFARKFDISKDRVVPRCTQAATKDSITMEVSMIVFCNITGCQRLALFNGREHAM